jgi:hypothetical protein
MDGAPNARNTQGGTRRQGGSIMSGLVKKQCSEIGPDGSLFRKNKALRERSPWPVNNQPSGATLRRGFDLGGSSQC